MGREESQRKGGRERGREERDATKRKENAVSSRSHSPFSLSPTQTQLELNPTTSPKLTKMLRIPLRSTLQIQTQRPMLRKVSLDVIPPVTDLSSLNITPTPKPTRPESARASYHPSPSSKDGGKKNPTALFLPPSRRVFDFRKDSPSLHPKTQQNTAAISRSQLHDLVQFWRVLLLPDPCINHQPKHQKTKGQLAFSTFRSLRNSLSSSSQPNPT